MTEDEIIRPTSGKLFSPGQVATAAFLGGPLPGAILLSKNYLTLGNKDYAVRSALGGIIATILLFGVAAMVPPGFPNMVIPVAYTVGLRELTRYLQGEDAVRFESEGRKGSWLVPVALGLGFMAAMLLILMALGPLEQQ